MTSGHLWLKLVSPEAQGGVLQPLHRGHGLLQLRQRVSLMRRAGGAAVAACSDALPLQCRLGARSCESTAVIECECHWKGSTK